MMLECPACGHRFEANSDPDELGNYCPKCTHGFHGGYV
jgi:hypothetical protein